MGWEQAGGGILLCWRRNKLLALSSLVLQDSTAMFEVKTGGFQEAGMSGSH